MIEVDTDNGVVTGRKLVNSANDVEAEASTYRGVFMDTRDDSALVKKPIVNHAQHADLDMIRRAKSDAELDVLGTLSTHTRELLENVTDERTFRGAAHEMGNRAYFRRHIGKGFTEYRGGMKDEMGRCSDLTRIVPHTTAWKERMERVNHGLDQVTQAAVAGVAVSTLDSIFRGCLDSTKDGVVSSCVHSTGYESIENLSDFSSLAPYDFVTIGVGVSDGHDTALVYRGTKQILPAPAHKVRSTRSTQDQPVSDPNPLPLNTVFRGSKTPSHAVGTVNGMSAIERAFAF
jgi:hypothetical protein|tara:strand:- start:1862 stop:2728 length:867 start_codon:yes stop_codon:yes gene_type:complete